MLNPRFYSAPAHSSVRCGLRPTGGVAESPRIRGGHGDDRLRRRRLPGICDNERQVILISDAQAREGQFGVRQQPSAEWLLQYALTDPIGTSIGLAHN